MPDSLGFRLTPHLVHIECAAERVPLAAHRQHDLGPEHSCQRERCDVAVVLVDEAGADAVPQQQVHALVQAALIPALTEVVLLRLLLRCDSIASQVWMIEKVCLPVEVCRQVWICLCQLPVYTQPVISC